MPEVSGDNRDEINALWTRLTTAYAYKASDGRWDTHGRRFTRVAEEYDLDKLRVYGRLLVEGVSLRRLDYIDRIITLLRRNGHSETASILTKEHFDALMAVEREIPKYSISIMNHSPFSSHYDALYLVVVKNVQRCDDILSIMAERRTVDPVIIGSLLDELSELHPVLGGGAL